MIIWLKAIESASRFLIRFFEYKQKLFSQYTMFRCVLTLCYLNKTSLLEKNEPDDSYKVPYGGIFHLILEVTFGCRPSKMSSEKKRKQIIYETF